MSPFGRERRPARKAKLSAREHENAQAGYITYGRPGRGGTASTRSVSQPASLNEVESAYADFNDASGAISLIESGLRDSYQGRTRIEWVHLQQQAREDVQRGLKDLAGRDLSPADQRAIDIISHAIYVSQPEAVAALIEKAARSIASK